MNPSMQRYLDAASGLTSLTRAKAEQVVKQLVRSGEAAGDQVGELVDDLLVRQRHNRDAMASMIRSESARAVKAMGLASSSEVERLQKQVAELKRELVTIDDERTRGATGGGTRSGAKKSTAKKATAKKSTAKKATAKKSTAKKSTAKKATAKKATAKKSTAKKATKRTAGGAS